MKIHWAGKFDGNEESLPHREHPEGYVPFKEMDMKKLSLYANVWAVGLILLFGILAYLRVKFSDVQYSGNTNNLGLGSALAVICLIPHEFLHAICFRGECSVYTNLSKGMLFVVGTEDMTKKRFVLMSLFPNIVFGLIPYVIFMIFPQYLILGVFGAISLGMGVGDYYNVFNALTQMPKGALTYLNGFHSYWYIPKN